MLLLAKSFFANIKISRKKLIQHLEDKGKPRTR